MFSTNNSTPYCTIPLIALVSGYSIVNVLAFIKATYSLDIKADSVIKQAFPDLLEKFYQVIDFISSSYKGLDGGIE